MLLYVIVKNRMLANCLCNKYLSPLHQWTPLYMAAEGGHEEMVRCLVDEGADINIKDENGVSICTEGELVLPTLWRFY